MRTLDDTLRRQFGFSSFRPHQEEIIRAILDGRDVFAALPTGGGKSLCYQLPSLLLPDLTVVVSPLIALMHDQALGAKQNDLAAAVLNSSLAPAEVHAVWSGLARGEVRLLYVSPERIALDGFRERLRDRGVGLFAIDEAHCISEWGHEFRPDYRALSVLRTEFPGTPIAAFTATATTHVQDDVIRQLGLRNPLCVRGDFDRREIFYRVERKGGVSDQILSFVLGHPHQAGIVYRATRKSVEQTTTHLRRHGVDAVSYHAGLSDGERRANQEAFVRDDVQVVVATIAFGMGIDKSNVRWVLHGDLPRSLEAYYQETGRAGRDGSDSEACLLYGPQDIATIRYHIERMEIDEERERAEWSLQNMLRYVNAGVCRRIQLLAHFDQRHAGNCGGCDICVGDRLPVDCSVEAQKAMSAIVRTGERFGAHHVADIVCGQDTERVRQFGHHRLPTFGVGADRPREWWLELLKDMEAAGLVRRRDGARSGLALTAAGREVLSGARAFTVVEREPAATPTRAARERGAGNKRRAVARSGARGASTGPATGAAAGAEIDSETNAEENERLFQCLRAVRRRLATEQNVPPYVIFSDRTLSAMARERPTDDASLLRVHGVGTHKLARYGEVFVEAIREFEANGSCRE